MRGRRYAILASCPRNASEDATRVHCHDLRSIGKWAPIALSCKGRPRVGRGIGIDPRLEIAPKVLLSGRIAAVIGSRDGSEGSELPVPQQSARSLPCRVSRAFHVMEGVTSLCGNQSCKSQFSKIRAKVKLPIASEEEAIEINGINVCP
jgi:hypothetical protein